MLVETNISVTEMQLLRIFLDANDMTDSNITYRGVRNKIGHIENLISIDYAETDAANCNRVYMALKYASLEEAFKLYCSEVRRIGQPCFL